MRAPVHVHNWVPHLGPGLDKSVRNGRLERNLADGQVAPFPVVQRVDVVVFDSVVFGLDEERSDFVVTPTWRGR